MTTTRLVKVRGSFLNSFRSETKLTAKVALAELIDNCLDAHARNIRVDFDEVKDRITIRDDGRGCADITRFVDLGSDAEQEDLVDRVGRYGVGHKHAAVKLCDDEHVVSVYRGTRREARIPWTAMAKSNEMKWHVEDDRPTRAESGTTIELRGIRDPSVWLPRTLNACRDYWSMVYMPALAAGRVIAINGDPLDSRPRPPLLNAREWSGDFEGKKYRACVGILETVKDIAWKSGWYVACAGRLMNDRPLVDSMDDYPGAAIWGYFELVDHRGAKWALDTNKTDFAEREPFFAHIAPLVDDLLRAAFERGVEIETGLIENAASEALAAAMGGLSHIREKRNRTNVVEGTVVPINTGRRRERAEKVDPNNSGSVIEGAPAPHRPPKLWSIKFRSFGADADICQARISKQSAWVEFNLDHGFVIAKKDDLDALIPIAVFSIWEAADQRKQGELWAQAELTDMEMAHRADERAQKWVTQVLKRYIATKQTKKRKRA